MKKEPSGLLAQDSKRAMHYLDKSKPYGGEIACGWALNEVGFRNQATVDTSLVTCV